MSVEFTADEVFEMAEQIERNGARFYRQAAETAEGDAQRILTRFARMEDEHEKTFKAMRAELPPEAHKPSVWDPDNEVGMYLQAMADGYVFDIRGEPAALTGKETIEGIFTQAIGREKESVVFYVGLKEMVPGDAGQDKIDRIIREEMSHIGILSTELAKRR